MKHPFFKSALVLAAALALLNCSEEATNNIPSNAIGDALQGLDTAAVKPGTTPNNPSQGNGNIVVNEPSWLLQADQTYVINTSGVVFDASGNIVGVYNQTTQSITTVEGTPIIEGVDLNVLPVVTPEDVSTPNQGNPNSGVTTPENPTPNVPNTPNTVHSSSSVKQPIASSSSVKQPVASSSSVKQPAASSSSNQQQSSDGTCFDKFSGKNVKPYDNLQANGASYAYKEDCTINCYYDPAGQNCANLGSGTNNNNQQQQPQSSSSQPKSSSSVKSSSSSVVRSSSSVGGNSGSYTIKYVSGGKSGSGWATRYWDCCKPHCAWPGKGGIQAHACDASGNRISDDGAKSMCDGGNSGTCKSQIPIVVNDNLAFAFAAVPGSAGGECGKCFDLEFTGKGKYATDNHTALKGKHLIVIASNIGYDVADGQFDIMIPGGGFGIFDGCSAKMGWGSQGARYGGLLTECEESSGYKASTYKSCLTSKCNASFSSDPVAKEGCLFLANWMNAAGNPLHNFREVECPKELLDKF